jgi:ABC-type multidrug transport system fused ATPase/permease subunit
MSADQLVKLLGGLFALLVAVLGPASWLCREFIKYLFQRIATLETREQTVLTGLVQVAKELTEGQKIVNDFVLESNEERRYEQRKRDEDRRREGRQ